MTKANDDTKKLQNGIVPYIVNCIGISPMLQNPMTDEVLDELLNGKAGTRKPKVVDVTVEERAVKKLCLGPSGQFGFPTNYLFAALVEAGRHVTYAGKQKISTKESSLVANLVTIIPDLVDAKGDGFIPFLDQDVKWIADKRRGVLKTGASQVAVAIVRPKFLTWAFDVTIEVDHDQIAIEKVKELFVAAGRIAGIGDFRPSKRGLFGRFKVGEFVAVEQQLDKAA